jgi:preprotein translocase subunit SecG
MLSGLLITIDIVICIALIGVVLMQRSEGGAFGMGGGPTGLVTARGAGDLLTRVTWILFGLFLALSLGLTLLGAHDRATSSLTERLKLQHANPNELNQPATPPAGGAPLTAPGPTPSSLVAPVAPAAQPLTAPAPQPLTTVPNLGQQPVARPRSAHVAAQKAEAPTTIAAPPPAAPAPPVLEAPKPAPAPPVKPASDAPAPAAP